jgi:hypothetical protein
MTAYHLKKWFFDFAGEKGEYTYFFIAEIRVFFLKIHFFNLHHFDGTGESLTLNKNLHIKKWKINIREFHIDSREINIIKTAKDLYLSSNLPEITMNIVFSGLIPEPPAKMLKISHKSNNIIWYPFRGFITANGLFRRGETESPIPFKDSYIDYVFSGIVPWRVPVKKMHWGRILHSRLRISWSVTYSHTGSESGLCYLTMPGIEIIFDDLILEVVNGRTDGNDIPGESSIINLKCTKGNYNLTIEADNRKIVSGGPFINPGMPGNKQLLKLLKRISGDPRGEKFISLAKVKLEADSMQLSYTDLNCITEYVLF